MVHTLRDSMVCIVYNVQTTDISMNLSIKSKFVYLNRLGYKYAYRKGALLKHFKFINYLKILLY